MSKLVNSEIYLSQLTEQYTDCSISYLNCPFLKGILKKLSISHFGSIKGSKIDEKTYAFSEYYPPKLVAVTTDKDEPAFALKNGKSFIPFYPFLQAINGAVSGVDIVKRYKNTDPDQSWMIGELTITYIDSNDPDNGLKVILPMEIAGNGWSDHDSDAFDFQQRIRTSQPPEEVDLLVMAPKKGRGFIKIKDLPLGRYKLTELIYKPANEDRDFDSVNVLLDGVEDYVSVNSLVREVKNHPTRLEMINSGLYDCYLVFTEKKPWGTPKPGEDQKYSCKVALQLLRRSTDTDEEPPF
jgi:hypothetical protein